MKLEYNILWFDDQPQAIKPFADRIRSFVARLGFEPNIDLRIVTAEVEDPLADLPLQREVDLVLMDWKLGGDHDGAKLARRVRQPFRDTDIVFYSSETSATLRQLIFNQGIDGVFCCNRTSLTERTSGIIQAQLRRTLDLNHMRGVVMAATSDLDHGMIECLELVQQLAYPNGPGEFAASVSAQIAGALRSKAIDIEKMGRSAKVSQLLKEPSFGSALRLGVLKEEVAKLRDRLNEDQLLAHLETYHAEVITPRNDFAHRKAEMKGEKLVLAGRDQAFDQESMKTLRLQLLKHSDNLRALLTLLSELASDSGQPSLATDLLKVEAVVSAAAVVIDVENDATPAQGNGA